MNNAPAAERVRFGVFEFDCRNGELTRDGTSLKLQPQPAKVLGILVSRPGEIVTRQQLSELVWGSETFVDFEQGLNFAIRQIRTVLQDDAENPRYLETLPRRGYRFVAPVENLASKSEERVAEEPSSPARSSLSRRKPSSQLKMWAGICGLALLLGLIALMVRRPGSTAQNNSASVPIRSIAVLPLVNLSTDPSQEYFSDGLTDELITELAKTGNLRVISRTSVMGLKGSRKTTPEIGRELRVDAIVEGTVEKVGSRIRIRAQLIRAEPDQHLWAESYDRDVGNLLSLERDVARDIASHIGYRTAVRASEGPDRISSQAHEDYLKGRYYWNKRTEADLRKGIEYFHKVIEQEPRYGLAYVGLADSYIMLANWGFTSPVEAYLNAKESALKALELDDQLAEAHTSLAYATLLYDWDWNGAENRFRQAIALNPNYASAHHFYSILLMASGRQAEAIAEIERARDLDPLSLIVNDVVGWVYYQGRQYDRAIEQYTKTLEMDPRYAPALLDLGTVYLKRGDYGAALAQFAKASAAGGENGTILSRVAQAYVLSGRREEGLKILDRLRKRPAPLFVSSWDVSFVYGALGKNDQAIALLEEAAREHVGWVIRLGTEPLLDNLRSDPKFQALVRQIGPQLKPSTSH